MSYISLAMFQRFCDGLAKVVNKKLDATGVANNDTTTAEGYVADARIVKTHGDEIDALAKKNNGLYFDTNSDGKWGYKTSSTGTLIPFRNPTGNAAAADVLSGKIFSSASQENVAGTMPNRGELNVTLTPTGNNTASQEVAAGYYSGGTITADGNSSYNRGYANKTLHRVVIGTGGNGTYSAASIPNFQSLTLDNFAFNPTNLRRTDDHWGNPDTYSKGKSVDSSTNCSMSYNASNGILTVSGLEYSNAINESGGKAIVTGQILCFYAQ